MDSRDYATLPLYTLFLGIGLLLMGNGLQGTLLAVRGVAEGFGTDAIGFVMAGYFLGFVAGSVYTVPLIERAGHIRTFAALASIASAVALAHLVLIDEVVWGVLRGVTGFCFAGLYMVVESWLNERATNRTRGRIFSAYMIVNLAGTALGQFLLTAGDPGGFIPFCLVSIVISVALVPVALTRAEAPAPTKFQPLSLRRLSAISPLGVAGCIVTGAAIGAFWGLAPVFAAQSGFNVSGIAAFMAATILGGLVFQWPIGLLSDRVDRRTVIIWVCLVGGAVSLALAFGRGLSGAAILGLAFLFGGLTFPLYSLNIAHVNDLVGPADRVPVSSSLLLIYGIAATVGPIAAGLIMSATAPGGLYLLVAAGYLALGAFGLHRMRRRTPVPVAEQEPFAPAPRTTPVAYELAPGADEGEGEALESEPKPEE